MHTDSDLADLLISIISQTNLLCNSRTACLILMFDTFWINVTNLIAHCSALISIAHWSIMSWYTVFSLIEPPGSEAMVWGGYNRKNHKKTQKWPYLSQKWSDFHFVKRVLKLALYHMQIYLGRFYWKGGSIRENTVIACLTKLSLHLNLCWRLRYGQITPNTVTHPYW